MAYFYSDSGKPCMCGGTIYRYDSASKQGEVKTYCYSCHAEGYFYPRGMPQTAPEMSKAHRED